MKSKLPSGLLHGTRAAWRSPFLSLRRARRLVKVVHAAGSLPPANAPAVDGLETPVSASAPLKLDAQPVPIGALPSLLDRDERRLYLEARGAGGVVYQKDFVARGTFSRAKVTRLLDKLEAKGLVARERCDMTNRIRLLDWPNR